MSVSGYGHQAPQAAAAAAMARRHRNAVLGHTETLADLGAATPSDFERFHMAWLARQALGGIAPPGLLRTTRREPLDNKVQMDEIREGKRHHRRVSPGISAALFLGVIDFPIMLWLASSVFNVDWAQPLGLPLVISLVLTLGWVASLGRMLHGTARDSRARARRSGLAPPYPAAKSVASTNLFGWGGLPFGLSGAVALSVCAIATAAVIRGLWLGRQGTAVEHLAIVDAAQRSDADFVGRVRRYCIAATMAAVVLMAALAVPDGALGLITGAALMAGVIFFVWGQGAIRRRTGLAWGFLGGRVDRTPDTNDRVCPVAPDPATRAPRSDTGHQAAPVISTAAAAAHDLDLVDALRAVGMGYGAAGVAAANGGGSGIGSPGWDLVRVATTALGQTGWSGGSMAGGDGAGVGSDGAVPAGPVLAPFAAAAGTTGDIGALATSTVLESRDPMCLSVPQWWWATRPVAAAV